MPQAIELTNPWLRSGTNSPVVGFWVLKNHLYDGNLSNIATGNQLEARKIYLTINYYHKLTQKTSGNSHTLHS